MKQSTKQPSPCKEECVCDDMKIEEFEDRIQREFAHDGSYYPPKIHIIIKNIYDFAYNKGKEDAEQEYKKILNSGRKMYEQGKKDGKHIKTLNLDRNCK